MAASDSIGSTAFVVVLLFASVFRLRADDGRETTDVIPDVTVGMLVKQLVRNMEVTSAITVTVGAIAIVFFAVILIKIYKFALSTKDIAERIYYNTSGERLRV